MALTCPFCQTRSVDEAHALLSLRLGLPFGCARCGRALKQVHLGETGRSRAGGREALITLLTALVAGGWILLARPLRTAALTWPSFDLFGRPASVYLGRVLYFGGVALVLAVSVAVSAALMVRELRRDSRPARFEAPSSLSRLVRYAGIGLALVLAWYLRAFSLLRNRVLLFVLGALAVAVLHTVLVTLVAWAWLRRRGEGRQS